MNLLPTKTEGNKSTFTFPLEMSEFSQLVLIAVDKDSITQKTVDIEASPVQKRDLRLLQILDQDQGLTESRTTLNVLKNEEQHIEDISSTNVTLVDDLCKIHEILKEIRKVQHVSSQGFEAFDFILRWHTLTAGQKDRLYSDHCCHELNFFIQKRDIPYFNSTVRPFL